MTTPPVSTPQADVTRPPPLHPETCNASSEDLDRMKKIILEDAEALKRLQVFSGCRSIFGSPKEVPPLHEACYQRHLPCMSLMLQMGADVSFDSGEWDSPLVFALMSDRAEGSVLESTRLLLDHNVPLNRRCSREQLMTHAYPLSSGDDDAQGSGSEVIQAIPQFDYAIFPDLELLRRAQRHDECVEIVEMLLKAGMVPEPIISGGGQLQALFPTMVPLCELRSKCGDDTNPFLNHLFVTPFSCFGTSSPQITELLLKYGASPRLFYQLTNQDCQHFAEVPVSHKLFDGNYEDMCTADLLYMLALCYEFGANLWAIMGRRGDVPTFQGRDLTCWKQFLEWTDRKPQPGETSLEFLNRTRHHDEWYSRLEYDELKRLTSTPRTLTSWCRQSIRHALYAAPPLTPLPRKLQILADTAPLPENLRAFLNFEGENFDNFAWTR